MKAALRPQTKTLCVIAAVMLPLAAIAAAVEGSAGEFFLPFGVGSSALIVLLFRFVAHVTKRDGSHTPSPLEETEPRR